MKINEDGQKYGSMVQNYWFQGSITDGNILRKNYLLSKTSNIQVKKK